MSRNETYVLLYLEALKHPGQGETPQNHSESTQSVSSTGKCYTFSKEINRIWKKLLKCKNKPALLRNETSIIPKFQNNLHGVDHLNFNQTVTIWSLNLKNTRSFRKKIIVSEKKLSKYSNISSDIRNREFYSATYQGPKSQRPEWHTSISVKEQNFRPRNCKTLDVFERN